MRYSASVASLRLASRTTTIAVLAALAAVVPACASTAPRNSSSKSARGTAALSGPLNVFAAASLTGAFQSAEKRLASSNTGLSITYDFAGTNTLVTQIEQGAPADVLASADVANMDRLVREGLVEPPVTFARNKLEIAVAPGNPKHITGLADLARTNISVVLAAPGVPDGDYTREALSKLHIRVTPKSLETDVKSALAKVVTGEADATVVYVTDVRAAGTSVTGVAIPDSEQPEITYPIAVIKSSVHKAAARAFVESAVSGAIQRDLEAAGFLPPG